MKNQFSVAIVFIILELVSGFSKYGRTCSDIGCLTNEVCVMAEDPCRTRDEPCGQYPTCQRVANSVASCATFVCPPTTVCRLDRDTPKCVSDNGASANNGNPYAGIDPHSATGGSNGNSAPSAPNLYPQVPSRGQTTTRAPIHRPNANNGGGGYQGGSIGSGYPGQPAQPQRPSNYPSNNYPGYPGGSGYSGGAGYPVYPAQPNNGGSYPGYPGYPSQGGYSGGGSRYPNQGNQGGYQNPYGNNQGGYQNPYNSKPANSGSNPLYDKITDTLKNIGLFCILIQNLITRLHQV